ncbi:metallophosphoesterase [Rhizobiales bacterium RZME27]|uniref:Metallophosphoesterase n=1 Tax=Endobacterium cereale TaxID=2663029 RepID=A0A6A8ACA7_9HYPH|nr:metallophosphoesterase [Endobacterium cereale]MEB2847827.1 metallophosphoesterase [Endobacterium cereale]MQY46836.1 metallophosphoesterase [Endobacterium cereale]
MFHIIFGIPWLVVVLRFIQPLPWLWSAKTAAAIILLLASQYHLFSRLSSGSVFSPEFPRPLIIAFNVLFGTIVLLAVFQIALDLVSLVMTPFNGQFPLAPAPIRYIIGGVAFCLSAYGVSQAIRVPPLKDIEISIAGLPPEFDGYRLVQLTDLHISRLFPAQWTREVVAKTNALNADLIVITGDFIDGSVENRREDVAPLAGLRARDGVFAIPGNHEYFFAYDQWMRHLGTMNMTMLLNTHVVLTRGDARMVIAGVTDVSAAEHGSPAPDLDKAIQGAPSDPPVILLDHQPMMAGKAAESGVALQLSGHTHGGMVLGLDRLVARANNGFVSGRYEIGGMTLYVNNGTALWPGFAIRLGVPAELTRITLKAKASRPR